MRTREGILRSCDEYLPARFRKFIVNELSAIKLFPLRGRKIILMPDTDEHHQAYSNWYKICQSAQHLLGHPIHLSPLLEQKASRTQKSRKIDILDYYYESNV